LNAGKQINTAAMYSQVIFPLQGIVNVSRVEAIICKHLYLFFKFCIDLERYAKNTAGARSMDNLC